MKKFQILPIVFLLIFSHITWSQTKLSEKQELRVKKKALKRAKKAFDKGELIFLQLWNPFLLSYPSSPMDNLPRYEKELKELLSEKNITYILGTWTTQRELIYLEAYKQFMDNLIASRYGKGFKKKADSLYISKFKH